MFAVKMNSRLRAHKSNIGLALLALTDFFVGVLAQPAFIALIISLLVDDDSSRSCTLPNFTIAVSRIGVSVSLVHTVLISGERYLAIRHSFAYFSLVTEARLLVASVLAWLLSITLHIPVAVNESVFLPIKNTLYGLCVVLIIFCHVTVYLEIRRHQKQIAAQQVTEEAKEQFQKDKKAFKVTFIVIVVLMLCSFPIVTFTEVLRRYRGKLSLGVFYISFFLATLMASLNSFFNPLIYTFRLREFRVALIGLICRTVNIAEAEQIEMKIFGAPNAVVRIEEGQGHQGQAQGNKQDSGSDFIPSGCEIYAVVGGRLHQPSILTQAFLIIIIVVNTLTFPLTAALNALVMIAVKKKPRLREHKSKIALALLASTDFVVGVIVQPVNVALMITILTDDISGEKCAL
ncbi:unnamed protein product [Porites lobata]|uniref:G-protein coupled receptors family 1 profile domain-containing protein n=1 Tax=Porites lobata TaxID=104759 RepID=A0ABN8ND10_9CNID|nr:unnamed protein product [Porites lobata]